MSQRVLASLLVAAALTGAIACGKKGPPLAPLRPVPDVPTTVTASRFGPDVHLRFVVPAQNVGVAGQVEIDRVEIYAASVAAGAPAPPNREFLTPKFLVGTVDVRPPDAPGKPLVDPAVETRPAPGEPATFVEPLTTEMLNPPVAPPPAGAPIVPGAAPALPPAAATPPAAYATRIYSVRGVTSRGRPGNPSPRITVPLVDPPPPPAAVTVDFTASDFVVSWIPPVAEMDGAALLFNLYRAEAPSTALTPAPVATPTADVPGVEFGTERCFAVRSVLRVAAIAVESEASAPVCVTPRDVFPPAAPTGLTGVASPGGIAIIWDPNAEADLAGYLVLRGEAAGDTLQLLTPEPILETSYRDTTVTPGVRYVYVVVAVDRATPPNRSAHSTRVEVTAAQ
ncbi:MAG: hypothetical protein H0T05_05375 [Acidobacteria bacterium]|nr:hypothetical protein [Acidobacteriota bacterium]MBA3886091.1 hypothetical protein [Acidobacteriota bacterium]